MKRNNDVGACLRAALEQYLEDLDGEQPSAIYDMVLRCIEPPMLEVVMRCAGGNQTDAAAMLGINRNTLRKKLQQHKLKP
jgi:Fis family transcriptional regulator